MNLRRSLVIGCVFVNVGSCIVGCSSEASEESIELESIDSLYTCGAVDWQEVESYSPALGVSAAFVAKHEGAVNHAGCTGTLISSDLFITAGHCVTNPIGPHGGTRDFNHQLDPNGVVRPIVKVNVVELLEVGDELDYAIYRLEGSPGEDWGYSVPSAFAPVSEDVVVMMHHPGVSRPKKVGVSGSWYSGGDELRYDLDTEGGSSGAGVLQANTGNLIAVHSGGRSSNPCRNGGPVIAKIWRESPIIRRLAIDASKLVAALN